MPITEYAADSGHVLADATDTAYQASAPDAANEHFTHLNLAALVPSRTNPRTVYDQDKLKQLAESIRASGVHQPILVRPLPASRMADTAHLQPRPTHEIVAGERRYRASTMAGRATIPAMVRTLDDGLVLEIQLIENMQRDDLTPLEEAAGYARLIAETSISKEDIGARIGKSRGYVYGRLKLMELIPKAADALRKGDLEATSAQLIARIPDPKLQAKALEQATRTTYGGDRALSYREFADWVHREVLLPLNKARFKISDASLVPAAGACPECPKRTGANPDLFSDVKSADVCTDPACYHEKDAAHSAKLVQDAKAKGQTVIAGKEAQELVTGSYQPKFKGYRRLDVVDDSPTDQPLRKIIGAQMKAEGITPVMIEHAQKKGELVAALPNDVVLRLLKAVEGQAQAGKQVAKEVRQLADDKKAKAAQKAQEQYEQEWRDQLLARTWARLQQGDVPAFTLDVHRFLAVQAVARLSTSEAEAICKLLDLGKVGAGSALMEYAESTPHPDLLQLLMVMQRDVGAHDWTYSANHERINNRGLMLIAGIVHGDGLASVTHIVQAEAHEKFLAEPAPKSKPPMAHPERARYTGPNGETWSGRGLKPRWIAVLLEQGRTLEEFDTSAPTSADGPAAQASTTREGKGPAGKHPAAQARTTPTPKRKSTAQEAMAGIAAAMQSIEASAPADAATPNDAAQGSIPGSADAPQGIEASALADAPLATASATDVLLKRATVLVTSEQRANVRMLKAGLSIGTDRAIEVMAALEAAGTVSACDERGARVVLVSAGATP